MPFYDDNILLQTPASCNLGQISEARKMGAGCMDEQPEMDSWIDECINRCVQRWIDVMLCYIILQILPSAI